MSIIPKSTPARIVAGACALVALAFGGLLVLGLVLIATGQVEPEPTPEPTAATAEESEPPAKKSEPAEEESEEPEPTEEAQPKEEPTKEEEPTEAPKESTPEKTAEAPDPADEAQEWADAVNETAQLGSTWEDICAEVGEPDSSCYIREVYSTQKGQLKVKVELPPRLIPEDAGTAVANTFLATAGPEHADLEWVIVEDMGGTVITQESRADNPFLD